MMVLGHLCFEKPAEKKQRMEGRREDGKEGRREGRQAGKLIFFSKKMLFLFWSSNNNKLV